MLTERDRNRLETIEETLIDPDPAEVPLWSVRTIEYLMGLVGGLDAALESHCAAQKEKDDDFRSMRVPARRP
jgi:hypothetical protein